MTLIEWLTKTSLQLDRKRKLTGKEVCRRPEIVCGDGLTLSVQASESHRSIPNAVANGEEYSALEVFAEGRRISDLEDFMDLDGTYPFTPVCVLQTFINEHGGIRTGLGYGV